MDKSTRWPLVMVLPIHFECHSSFASLCQLEAFQLVGTVLMGLVKVLLLVLVEVAEGLMVLRKNEMRVVEWVH